MTDPVNINSILGSSDVTNVHDVSGKDLLFFAKRILLYLFLLVIFVFSCSYILASRDPGNELLAEIVKIILGITQTAVPSIVSLVLGFYFGKRSNRD